MQHELQHRGRDAAGIAVFGMRSQKIQVYKNLGRVKEVFPQYFDFSAFHLLSDRGIGHNRYGTSGNSYKDSVDGAQPVIVSWQGRVVAIAYNGNLPESERKKLKEKIPSQLSKEPDFDTYDIARAIVSSEGLDWPTRIKNALKNVHLAYALTILTDTGEIYGLVCPSETWPLWVGETQELILLASETRVYKRNDIIWKPVRAGQLVQATEMGVITTQLFSPQKKFRCALHDQYGARADSLMTPKLTFREFRVHLGQRLAREHPLEMDIYAGVPYSGIPMAEGYVQELGKKLTPIIELTTDTRGFIGKNENEINTVISGKYKIAHTERIYGKKVLLIDDSLIRGKTAGGDPLRGVKGIIQLVRDAGAHEVHFAVTLPKFTKDCDMGYYIRKDTLIALYRKADGEYEQLSSSEIASRIGADGVYYLSTESVKSSYEWALGDRESACTRCMGGIHPLEILKKQGEAKPVISGLIYAAV